MRDAFSTALKLLLVILLLAVGIAVLDLRVIQPLRTPPCNPELLEEGHVCLSQLLKDWPGKIGLDRRQKAGRLRTPHHYTGPRLSRCALRTTITRNCLPMPWKL